ncbi:MAG: band 7 protein [Proteobacteria bacterium]|nr:MAG: band 7 protein [Pseudomonadota bacterium]
MSFPFAIGIVVLVLLLLAAVFVAFYTRSTKETAFVRTGFGGEKVFMDRGGFVFPVLHDKIEVNMKTLKIVIDRSDEKALRTRDRLKIDVNSEFFLRVEPTQESISRAAQTLGSKTMDHKALEKQVEGRCDDALRGAAVLMDMEEMNDKRKEFGHNVEEGVKVDLAKMGLMLESVALTRLNQASLDYFDSENAFDVQGRTFVMERIADNEKRQNEVENAKTVAIKKGDLDAHNKQLELEKQKVFADQQQKLRIAEMEFDADRKIEEARIQMEIDLEEMRRQQSLAIAKAEKSIAENWIVTDEAKAAAAAKKEGIITAQEKAQADRNRLVEVISAEKEADRQRIFAAAHADAEIREAEAAKVRLAVEAAGKTALNKAANELSKKQIDMQVKAKIVQQLPDIIRESVKPLENIDGIKIMQVDGFSNVVSRGSVSGAGGGGDQPASGGGSLADQVVDSALRYRAQAPMVESLLNEVGLNGSGIKDFTKMLQREIKPGADQAASELAPLTEAQDSAEMADQDGEIDNADEYGADIITGESDSEPPSPPKPN